MAKPIVCYAGQFFGGDWKPKNRAGVTSQKKITAIQLVPTSLQTGAETSIEIFDHPFDVEIQANEDAKKRRVFQAKVNVETGPLFFNFNANPLQITRGLTVGENVNCRPIFYEK